MATVLLLIGALFGLAPATAQAMPAPDSVSYIALSSKPGGASGGGISKSGGGIGKGGSHRKSRGGGYSYGRTHGSSSTGKKMPLWQAILVLLVLGCLIVWGVVKLVRKVRNAVNT
ncbi:hypothetical protein [Streptomyces sp. NPDC007905]|uniref:hypothetical protein n=1 Tax=Streptomyces sp. NPDC007905 TaxID=3364788 RepID=UPI0036E90DBA